MGARAVHSDAPIANPAGQLALLTAVNKREATVPKAARANLIHHGVRTHRTKKNEA